MITFVPTDPLSKLKPQSNYRGLQIYSSAPGLFSEITILEKVPIILYKNLKVIFDKESPIPLLNACNGWYHKFYKVAWIRTGSDRAGVDIQKSLLHELGHHIWTNLPELARSRFVDCTKRCIKGGMNDWTNEEERFADGFTLNYLPTEQLSRYEIKVIRETKEAVCSLVSSQKSNG